MKQQSKPRPPTPPPWVDRILHRICDSYLLEGILGDLHEIYEVRMQGKGKRHAAWWYPFDAIGFMRPFAWKKFSFHTNLLFQITMFRNYAKIAGRNLLKYKMNTAINLFGLTVGTLACLLIGLFVWDELKYDTFHPEGEFTYRLYNHRGDQNGTAPIAMVPPTFGPTLSSEFPEVKQHLRIMNRYGKTLFKVGDKSYLEEKGIFAEPAIFDFFNLTVIAGDPATALEAPNALVITQELGQKYFADENPLGKNINIQGKEGQVTAVIRTPPGHFHLDFDYIVSFETINQQISPERINSWIWQQFFTYVKLGPQAEIDQLQDKFQAYVKENAWPQTRERGFTYLPHFQSLKDIHLHSADFRWDIAVRGNITYVNALIWIGIFLLLIACINFINLATARAERRAKEVGVRKVAGAYRYQLVTQFISEAVFLALLAMVFSLLLANLLLPYLNDFTDKQIVFHPMTHPWIFILLIVASLGLGVLAGSYPAFVLSAFKPIWILGGNKGTGGRRGEWVRKGLVVVQFSLSVLLIISTLIIYQQVNYLNEKSLGFDREQVMLFPMKGNMFNDFEQTKAEFLRIPQVRSASTGYGFPGDIIAGDDVIKPPSEQSTPANLFTIDHDYIKTMGMEVIAGRDFSRDFTTDVDEAFVINETAVRELGYANPEDAIEQPLHWNMWNHNQELKKGRIIGVVKDFHFKSLHEKVGTAVLHIYPSAYWQMALRLQTKDLPETLAAIKKTWDAFETGYPFDYKFIDQSFAEMYIAEQKLSKLLILFTFLTIFVACIGLLGLVAFAAEQRTKEIGIRKVMGASARHILVLLTGGFLKLVLISILLASPIAWYGMRSWLESFPYRIDLSIWIFLGAGTAAVLIALMTVGFQSIRTALRNPVKALRYE